MPVLKQEFGKHTCHLEHGGTPAPDDSLGATGASV